MQATDDGFARRRISRLTQVGLEGGQSWDSRVAISGWSRGGFRLARSLNDDGAASDFDEEENTRRRRSGATTDHGGWRIGGAERRFQKREAWFYLGLDHGVRL